MGLFRFILLVLILGLIVYLIRLRGRRPAPPLPPPATMVRCAHCGLHIPENEAVTAQDRYYCSKEHLRLWQKQQG